MSTATLSSKYQVVIPKEVRSAMRLTSGLKVSIYPINSDYALISKQPDDYVQALKGLGKDVWKALGGGNKYLKPLKILKQLMLK